MAGPKNRRIVIVITSRASYGRIKTVLKEFKKNVFFELFVIVAGSALLYRHGRIVEYLKRDNIPVHQAIYCVVEGDTPGTMADTTSNLLARLVPALENILPDMVLTIADRHETIATAVATAYLNIPLVHLQGGEVSGSIDESVRHAITKLAHIHLPATKRARDNIIRLGEDPEKVFLVGCPSIDVARESYKKRDNPLEKYAGVGPNVDCGKPFILVLQHSVTTEYIGAAGQISETLNAVASLNFPTIWLSPNVDAGGHQMENEIRWFREKGAHNICFYRSFEPEDFYWLMSKCLVFIGNSSSAVREGAYLGTPCVNIGSRQTLRETGPNVMHSISAALQIYNTAAYQIDHGPYPSSMLYGSGRAAPKIVSVLRTVDLSIKKRLHYG